MKKNLLLRLTSLGLALVMTAAVTACGKKEEAVEETEAKPEKITMTFDSCMTAENGIDEVCAKYKELTGIELDLTKPDHDKYYENVTLSFASGNQSDVIEMNSSNYAQY
ncbi:MAG: hypothetical protein IJL89_09220, partial [Firmicutes bacterium]|nr:hypothetical protein [Bacillota bacterium]